jgi:hypothetical protein
MSERGAIASTTSSWLDSSGPSLSPMFGLTCCVSDLLRFPVGPLTLEAPFQSDLIGLFDALALLRGEGLERSNGTQCRQGGLVAPRRAKGINLAGRVHFYGPMG